MTAQDQPKGRGLNLAMPEVKKYSLEKNIPIFQPQKIRKNPEFIEKIKELNADIRGCCGLWKNSSKRIFGFI